MKSSECTFKTAKKFQRNSGKIPGTEEPRKYLALCEPWHHSLTIHQPPQHRPDQCKFLLTSISTTKIGACWRLSHRDGVMVHRVLKVCFCIVCFSLFCFPRLWLKKLLNAVHGQNEMTSCLFLPWTAQNIVFYWVF